MADKAQTIEQLAIQSRLCQSGRTGVSSEQYRTQSASVDDLLRVYLATTSTLHYRFLEAALQRAPLEQVEALLRHWLQDKACDDIAARLTAAPLHPAMFTRSEPLLQDLLTLCATRLLKLRRCSPVGSFLPAADHSLLQAIADCDHKVSFGRTVGAIGAGDGGRNLYLKCRRFNEQEHDFMAEPVMLSRLSSMPLQLESATLEPHGTTTFRTLESLFEKLHLSAKQKSDLVATIVNNKQELLDFHTVKRLLIEHTPGEPYAWYELRGRPENSNSPYFDPPVIKTEPQLADFLLNLPFPEQNRVAFINDLLPNLHDSVRARLVQQTSATLSDEQHWELLRATLPEGTLQAPVTAYLFSTPPEAHYHRYVTDSDLQSAVSQPLAKRPQTVALRAYLRDYGRLFHQGILGPVACNLFHDMCGGGTSYRFLYAISGVRPGVVTDFDSESTNYPNIGPVPMTLRDGGDARFLTPIGWRQDVESSLPSLQQSNPLLQQANPLPGTVEDRETIVESLTNAWLGTVLLLGRTLKAPTETHPDGWFNSHDPKKESALADLLGHMVVDLFSHSLDVDRTVLHARLCKQDEGRLINRCAREMQAWLSTAFTDHVLDKTVPKWLYPDYTGKRDNLLIPERERSCLRGQLARQGGKNHNVGLSLTSTPLQGLEILTKKALAEAVLLASQRSPGTCGAFAHPPNRKETT